MTLNGLIEKLTFISRQLTSGDIPLKVDGKEVDINATLEGEQGNYWCNINIKEL